MVVLRSEAYANLGGQRCHKRSTLDGGGQPTVTSFQKVSAGRVA